MHDPRVDADADHRRRDDQSGQDVSRRRRQAGAEECPEQKGEHHHGSEVNAGRLYDQTADLGGHAGNDERPGHNRQRRQEQRQIGGHVGEGVDEASERGENLSR